MCNLSEAFKKKLKWISLQLWKQQTTTMTKFWYAIKMQDYVMDVVDDNVKIRKIIDGLVVWTPEEILESDIGRDCHTRQNIDCDDFGKLAFVSDGCGMCFEYNETTIEAPQPSLISFKLMQIGE